MLKLPAQMIGGFPMYRMYVMNEACGKHDGFACTPVCLTHKGNQ